MKRIEEFDPKLNAFITVLADQAFEQAKDAEAGIKAGKWRGPSHGIPIGIGKTNMHKLGMGTTGLDSCFGSVHNPWNSELY